MRTASGFVAATCTAISFASASKSSVRATKSVSLFSSTSTATEPSWCTYDPIHPSDASRPARFSALAAPFLRRMSTALSRSPPHSCSALLQSIMPAPVRARSSATSFVGISFTEVIASFPFHVLIKTPPSRREARGRRSVVQHTELLRLAPANRLCRGGRFFRLHPSGNRLGLGPPFAPRRPLLAVAVHVRLARLRRVRRAFAFLTRTRLPQRHLAARLGDYVRDRVRDQRDGANRVVVPRNRHGDQIRIGIRIHDRHHRNPQLVRLGDRDSLLLGVHHEQRTGQAAQVLDAREILVQLAALAIEQQLLLLGVVREVAIRRTLLQVLEPLDLLLDRLEVRKRAAEPALRHVERAAALGFRLQDPLELLFGAHEQHAFTLQHDVAQQLLRGFELAHRLLQIDDVDAGAFGEDEPPHLRIPAASLMAEVHTCFQQFLQLRLRHAIPFLGLFRRRSHFRCHPEAPGTQHRIKQRVSWCLVSGVWCQTDTRHQSPDTYLLLNWNRFRAPARPGFLRSTARGSRVSKPCSLSFLRCLSSASTSARAIPRRNAPACPVSPPPTTRAFTSNAPSVSVAVNGCWMCETSEGRGK